ncbi:MAG TPA: TrkA family potassium uptake protein [Armatimonadota bacterium]|jgi:trk system potassium uptake protein TrkA
MKFVILGCGRVGSILAMELSEAGHDVTIIDRNKDAFRRLSPRFAGQTVFGMGIDEDVLRRAGIESADAFIALTQGDNTNIMASQVVQERFRGPKVLCRVYDPIRAKVFRELGIHTIPTAKLLAGLFSDMLLDQPVRSVAAYLGEPELAAGTEEA